MAAQEDLLTPHTHKILSYQFEVRKAKIEPKFEIRGQKSQRGNPRKFVCEVCLCSFSSPAAIAAHLATHGGTETFKCRLCEKSYIPTTNSKTNKDCGSNSSVH